MTCGEAHDLMLTAERHELRGEGDGPLAMHIAECSECMEAGRALSSGLCGLTARVNRRARRRAAIAIVIPAAAAAVFTSVLIVRQHGEQELGQASIVRDTVPASPPANVVSVDVATGQHATVLKTRDPSVTVVWISSGVGGGK